MSDFSPDNNHWVKICCIASLDEAHLANSVGVEMIGLVSRMSSVPGLIDEASIVKIADKAPAPLNSVLPTSSMTKNAIARQIEGCLPAFVQLVDYVDADKVTQLASTYPETRFIRFYTSVSTCGNLSCISADLQTLSA